MYQPPNQWQPQKQEPNPLAQFVSAIAILVALYFVWQIFVQPKVDESNKRFDELQKSADDLQKSADDFNAKFGKNGTAWK